MELTDILKKSTLFKDLKKGELEKISKLGSTKTCVKGEYIFEEDSEGDKFFIIISGTVAITKNIAGGRKRSLANLQSGDIFGEMALFDSKTRSANAEAIENTEVLVFDNNEFRELLKNNLVLAFIIQTRITRILCKRLRATNDMLKEGVIWGFTIDV